MLAYTRIDLGFDPANLYQLALSVPEQRAGGVGEACFAERCDKPVAPYWRRGICGGGIASSSRVLLFYFIRASEGSESPGTDALQHRDTRLFRNVRNARARGRGFAAMDRAGTGCVAIVDERFAVKYLRGSASGARLVPAVTRNPVCSVVGVVQSVRENFGSLPEPMLYLSANQFPEARTIVVRLRAGSSDLAKQAEEAFVRIDPTLPAPAITSYTSLIERETLGTRVVSVLFSALAIIALLLALSGIYSITSYSVERRWHESEFGKPSEQVRKTFSLTCFWSFGPIRSRHRIRHPCEHAACSGDLESTLCAPFDVASYAATVALCVAFTLVAALVPALKAVRTDPAVALRHE